jgi:hypothetical protein
MKRLVPSAIVLVAVLFIACAGGFYNGVNIESDQLADVDFTKLPTWKFAREDQYPETGIAALDDPAFRKSVAQHTITEMQTIGYKKVESDPDFVMMIHVQLTNEYDKQKMDDIYKGYDMAWSHMNAEDYWQDGTLMLFAMDSKTGKQIWSSRAHARLDDNTSASVKEERFKKVISMMLEDFPPIKK